MISTKRYFLFFIFLIILSSCLNFNEARRGGSSRSSSRGSSRGGGWGWGGSSKSHSTSHSTSHSSGSSGGGFWSRLFGGGSKSSSSPSSSSSSGSSYPKQSSSVSSGSPPSYGWNPSSQSNLESSRRVGGSLSQPGGHIVKPNSAAQPYGWNIPDSKSGSFSSNPKPSAPLGNPPPYGSWNAPGTKPSAPLGNPPPYGSWNTQHNTPLGSSNHNYNTNNNNPYGAGYQHTNSYPSNTHYNPNPQYPGQTHTNTYVHNTYHSPSSGFGSNTYVPIFIPSVHSHHQTYYHRNSNNEYSRRTPENVTDNYMPLFNGTTKKPNGRVVSIGKSGFVGAGVLGGAAGAGLLYGALAPSKSDFTTIKPDLLNSTTERSMNCVVGILVNSTECRKRLETQNNTTTALPDILSTTTGKPTIFNTTTVINMTDSTQSTIPTTLITTPSEVTVLETSTIKADTYTTTTEILSVRNTLEMIKEVDD